MGRCPQRLRGRPSPGLDKGQEIRKGTKCHGHSQTALPWGQHALGRQRVSDAVLAGGSSRLPTDGVEGILCPRPGSTTVSLCDLGTRPWSEPVSNL